MCTPGGGERKQPGPCTCQEEGGGKRQSTREEAAAAAAAAAATRRRRRLPAETDPRPAGQRTASVYPRGEHALTGQRTRWAE